jgi:hypothetical protein
MTHQELLDRRGEAKPDSGVVPITRMTRSRQMLWDLVDGRWHSKWSDDNYTVLDSDGLFWSSALTESVLLIPANDDGMPDLYEAIISQQISVASPTSRPDQES